MAEEEEAEQAPEVRRIAEEDIHYSIRGIKLSELMDRGLLSALENLSPGTEMKGVALGKARRDTWIYVTEQKPKKGRPGFHIHSVKGKETKLMKLLLRAIEEVSR
jgi:hypothetical protein